MKKYSLIFSIIVFILSGCVSTLTPVEKASPLDTKIITISLYYLDSMGETIKADHGFTVPRNFPIDLNSGVRVQDMHYPNNTDVILSIMRYKATYYEIAYYWAGEPGALDIREIGFAITNQDGKKMWLYEDEKLIPCEVDDFMKALEKYDDIPAFTWEGKQSI